MKVGIERLKVRELFNNKNLLSSSILLILLCLSIDAQIEYNLGGLSFFFYKDVLNGSLILMGLMLIWFKKISRSKVISIVIYSIVFGIIFSFPIRVNTITFDFESYFLKTEMIIMILTLAIGILVKPVHKIVMIGANVIFLIMCAVTIQDTFPMEKYIFYGVMVCGSGFIGYVVQSKFMNLNKELKKANNVILLQNNKLSKLNTSKDRLFRIIGHDLKAPFGQVDALIDLLNKSEEKKEKEYIISLIKASAQKGNSLLENLLHWAKEHELGEELQVSPISYGQALTNALRFSEVLIHSKQLEVVNEVNDQYKVLMSSSMLETVLRNFISNAIKFSNRGGTIFFNATEQKDELELVIKDKGVGMNKETINQLLNEEEVDSNLGTENEKGTGLGFVICKQLLEKHKGRLQIESELGRGTCVRFWLPLQRIHENTELDFAKK